MNVEVAHKLSEHETTAREKRRWEEIIEILEVLLLALAAIATAGGYQAAKGDGQQSMLYSESSVDRLQANTAAALGDQRLAADAAIFNSWLEARAAKNPQLQAMLARRFSPEYRTAFSVWLAMEPFTNPAAPPGPGYMAPYHNPSAEQAAQLNEKAAAAEEEGTEALPPPRSMSARPCCSRWYSSWSPWDSGSGSGAFGSRPSQWRLGCSATPSTKSSPCHGSSRPNRTDLDT